MATILFWPQCGGKFTVVDIYANVSVGFIFHALFHMNDFMSQWFMEVTVLVPEYLVMNEAKGY